MSVACAVVPMARESVAEYGALGAPPPLELRPYTRWELWERFRGGEREADDCERWLATAARARAALDLAIAEGLAGLRAGDRLAELGFHLDDYAREILGIGERTALGLVRLARELRSRPLLRAAVRAGEVGFRAAQLVLPVAVGEAEECWVGLASRETVRALEKRVAEARRGTDPEEEWGRLEFRCTPAAHFIAVWGMPARPRTVSQRVRERDAGNCTVPGCSHAATDAHHLVLALMRKRRNLD